MSSNQDISNSSSKSSLNQLIKQNISDSQSNDQQNSGSDGQKDSLGSQQMGIGMKRLATFGDIIQKVGIIKQELVQKNGKYLKEFGDQHLKIIKYEVLSKLDPMLAKVQQEIQYNINTQLKSQHKRMQENVIAALLNFFDFLLQQRVQEAVKNEFIRRKNKQMKEKQYTKNEAELPLLQHKIQTSIESFYKNNLCQQRKILKDEELTQNNSLLQQNTKIKHDGSEMTPLFLNQILDKFKEQIQKKIYQNRNENLKKTIINYLRKTGQNYTQKWKQNIVSQLKVEISKIFEEDKQKIQKYLLCKVAKIFDETYEKVIEYQIEKMFLEDESINRG